MAAQANVEAIAPLLLDAQAAAKLCSLGRTTWLRLHAEGRVPLPVRLGRRVLWRREEIQQWIAAGCPPRLRWAEIQNKDATLA